MFPPMILPPGPYHWKRAIGIVSLGSCHQVQSIGHGPSGGYCLMGQGDGSCGLPRIIVVTIRRTDAVFWHVVFCITISVRRMT